MLFEVVKANPQQSVVISAYSVLTPLAQLALASEGESHDELLDVISMPNDDVTAAAFSQAEYNITSIKGVELKKVSKVYVAQDSELNEEFANITSVLFNSEIENVNFAKNKETAKEINLWVENQTNHKIKDLIDSNSLNSDTRIILVNAIYFKGQWKNQFNKKYTTEKDFHVTKKRTVKVPMMQQTARFNYTDDRGLKAQILEMKYVGDEASMVIVLPNKINGVTDVVKKLKDPNALDRALKDKKSVEVNVQIPKFITESTTKLKDILEKLGVKKIFTPGAAQLTNLLKEEDSNIYISDGIQKAYIEVDEEGSEAAAANGNAFIQITF
ncbi:alaserpin-like [Zerene cesonia]|uniref:alaserpin-like n=1 Tax=Zerene cesonia TaxID=33412 RepID=UPI0018E4EDCE|nr:alaserpin-like [Zerene cesonia]